MSRAPTLAERKPFIAVVDKASQALAVDMVRQARKRGYPFIRLAHNAVFGTLYGEGGRISDMAVRAGITKQSMGEVVRELVDLGVLEMVVDPTDRRAKIVTYTEFGLEVTNGGMRYLDELERLFRREFGEADYETTRRVLEGVVELLTKTSSEGAEPGV